MAAKSDLKRWQLRHDQSLYSRTLSDDLYSDPGQCGAEGYRNGGGACMLPDGPWTPSRIRIEINVVRRHPLTGGSALVFFDAGSGFTDADIERFCTVSANPDQSTRFGGASQKRIGRFAILALCDRENPNDREFWILTRTSRNGPVKCVDVGALLRTGETTERLLEPDAKELDAYRNYDGSFSAIVVPDPVFRSNDELRKAVALKLPRKPEFCGRTLIGGKVFTPPPLAGGVVVAEPDIDIEAYLNRAAKGTAGGIWLVDRTTGFRAGFCPSLAGRLPYPLARPDLEGDIFLPGLLAKQGTARGGLSARFLATKEWQHLCDLMQAHVVMSARGLLEDDDVIERSPIGRLLADDIQSIFVDAFGKPEDDGADEDDGIPSPDGKPPKPPHPRPPGGGPGGGGGGGGKPKPRLRTLRWKIGDRTWKFATTQDEPLVFGTAILGANGVGTVYVNHDYKISPRGKHARIEHHVLQILHTVAIALHPGVSADARQFVAEMRDKLDV